jgi:hypothetical protein
LIAGLQCNYNAPTLFHNKKATVYFNPFIMTKNSPIAG